MPSPYLSRTLRTLAEAERETRDEQLSRLRIALDRVASLACDAHGDMLTIRECNAVSEIERLVHEAGEMLDGIAPRPEMDADVGSAEGEEHGDRAHFLRGVL
jgi:hypothetical protein